MGSTASKAGSKTAMLGQSRIPVLPTSQSSGATQAHMQSGDYAFVTTICNMTDYQNNTGDVQIERVLNLQRSLKQQNSSVKTLLLAHGYTYSAKAMLRRAGWDVRDTSHVNLAGLFTPILEPKLGYHWSSQRAALGIQLRSDGRCTAHKLLVWNLTEYKRVMLADSDICLLQDPLPWMHEHRDRYFVANSNGRWARGYEGIGSMLLYLQPDDLVFNMLIDMARTASYVPYTNGEQDVIETVFATHMQFPTLPNHTHTKDQGACSLAAVSRSVGKRTMHSDKPVLRAPRSFLEAATRARAAREQAEKEAAKREQQAREARRAIQEQQKREAWAVRRAKAGSKTGTQVKSK